MHFSDTHSIVGETVYTKHYWEFDAAEEIDYHQLSQEIIGLFPSNIFLIIKLKMSNAVQRRKASEQVIHELFGVDCRVCEESIRMYGGIQLRYTCVEVEVSTSKELLKLLIRRPYSSFCILSDDKSFPKNAIMEKIFFVLDKGPRKTFRDFVPFLSSKAFVLYGICGSDGCSFCVLEKTHSLCTD